MTSASNEYVFIIAYHNSHDEMEACIEVRGFSGTIWGGILELFNEWEESIYDYRDKFLIHGDGEYTFKIWWGNGHYDSYGWYEGEWNIQLDSFRTLTINQLHYFEK